MLDKLRLHLANPNSNNLPLSILAILCGLIVGLVIVAFRLIIETVQAAMLPDNNPENYEALSWWAILCLPILGGLLLGLLFQKLAPEQRLMGVPHTMERLAYHHAHLPFKNAFLQFICAAISIIAGHSVGREGPSIHLGAASGSLFGQSLRFPNNAIRTLTACGIAAAIAAAFNTPLAGVIFTLEVVLLEYTLVSFIPIILAAVAATTVCRLVFGDAPIFNVPPITLTSVTELPWMIGCGMIIGLLAVFFIRSLFFFSRQLPHASIILRMTCAGLIVGLCGLLAPQIMGIGYDTVNESFIGQIGIVLLILITFTKIIGTSASLGLGLPGGLIGPTLVIGACAGGAIGHILQLTIPDFFSDPGLYAMIGMAAMMGATLQAPMAALIALLELTNNPNIILPGMLAIIAANLVASEGFKTRGVFSMQLNAQGFKYHTDPVIQTLRRQSVTSIMDPNFTLVPQYIKQAQLTEQLNKNTNWLVIENEKKIVAVIPTANLQDLLDMSSTDDIDLLHDIDPELPANAISIQATLHEVYDKTTECEQILYVVSPSTKKPIHIKGIIGPKQFVKEQWLKPY